MTVVKVNDRADDGDAAAFASRRILLLSNVLRRASALRYRRMLDLTQSEWGIVAELGGPEPRTSIGLAVSLGFDKAQMSRAIASLVARGLVLRRANPDDAREVLLRLSAHGLAVRGELIGAGARANEWLLRDVPRAERGHLLAQLDAMMVRANEILQAERDTASAPARTKPGRVGKAGTAAARRPARPR